MTKLLIFGSKGFIGANIIDNIDQDRFKIFAPTSSQCDLTAKKQVSEYINAQKPNIIINAAFEGVSANIPFSIDYILKNTKMIVNILEACKQKKYIQKIIHIGSAAEYGDSTKKISENATLAPKNIYGTAKAISTLAAMELAREFSLPIVILRAFYLIGPHDDKTVTSRLIRAIIDKNEMSLTKGEHTRDYLYIKDFVAIIEYICKYPDKFKNGEVYNIGSGKGVKLNEVFKIIFKELDAPFKPQIRPYSKNEYFYQVSDISKLKKVMKDIEFTPLKVGIKKTIKEIYNEKGILIP